VDPNEAKREAASKALVAVNKKYDAARRNLELLQNQSKSVEQVVDVSQVAEFADNGAPKTMKDGKKAPKSLVKKWKSQVKAHAKFVSKAKGDPEGLIQAEATRVEELLSKKKALEKELE